MKIERSDIPFLLFIVAALLLGCVGPKTSIQGSDGRVIGHTSAGYRIEEIECLGHYYITVQQAGVVHAEHCPCKSK